MKVMKYIWLTFLAGLAAAAALRSEMDLDVAGQFYVPGQGFPAQNIAAAGGIHGFATMTPLWIGLALLVGLASAMMRRRPARLWLFLLLALLIGPGLIANIALKDHWGRARPVQTENFGGKAQFTPWWMPAQECAKNCSFIAGDAAFGFALAAPGLALRQKRRWFWGGTLAGIIMGANRIAMGAHFLSDVAWAGLTMLAAMFALYAALYGRRAAAQAWREI